MQEVGQQGTLSLDRLVLLAVSARERTFKNSAVQISVPCRDKVVYN